MVKGIKVFQRVELSEQAKEILPGNPTRLAAIITNTGPDTAYLGGGSGVTAADGLPLAPGAALVDEWSRDAWFAAINGGEACSLSVVEIQ